MTRSEEHGWWLFVWRSKVKDVLNDSRLTHRQTQSQDGWNVVFSSHGRSAVGSFLPSVLFLLDSHLVPKKQKNRTIKQLLSRLLLVPGRLCLLLLLQRENAHSFQRTAAIHFSKMYDLLTASVPRRKTSVVHTRYLAALEAWHPWVPWLTCSSNLSCSPL